MTDNHFTPAELVRTMHLELWGECDPTAIDRYISPDARTLMTGFVPSIARRLARRSAALVRRATTRVGRRLSRASDTALPARPSGARRPPRSS